MSIFISKISDREFIDCLNDIIELIIKARVYENLTLLKELKNKEILCWERPLEKAIMLDGLDRSEFKRFKPKLKIIDIMARIKETKKLTEFMDKLFAKIVELRGIKDVNQVFELIQI